MAGTIAAVTENNTVNDKDACEHLIFKLLLPVSLFGQELLTAKADKVLKFKVNSSIFKTALAFMTRITYGN